jgi:hypothetical protein
MRRVRRAHLGCATLLTMVALLGCGGDHVAQRNDGGDTVPRCTGAVVCDELLVRTCNDGEMGGQIDDCTSAGACSNGRCLSPGCATVEKDRTSFAGCLFYTAEVDNVASDATLGTSFLVTNAGDQTAVVVLQRLGPGGAWMPRGELVVQPGKSGRLSRPAEMRITDPGPRVAGAFRVWSNQPVSVEQIQSDDREEAARSSGGTMLLPAHVLGTHYRVMTYRQAETPDIAVTANSGGGAGRLLIVGTQPGTTVTFRRAESASSVVTGLPQPALGDDVFPLGDGDVFQAWTAREGDDLSGSEIVSNLPIAVFSGNISTTYGRVAAGVNTPDMAHEQMPPVHAWSRTYVAAALPPQETVCDTLLGASPPHGASIWRLLADTDKTMVQFAVPDGAPSVHEDVTMAAGQLLEFVATGDFVVTASQAVLLTQGIDCEATLSLAISAEKMLTDATFAVLPVFDQMIAVVREQPELIPLQLAEAAPVLLDGAPIEGWASAGGGYEVARVRLEPCPPSQEVCTHRLQGKFGAALRGMDVLASYATTLPAWGCSDGALDPMCIP